MDFLKRTFTWILKHKVLTIFLTVGAAALVMLVPSLLAGSLTNMLAVEIMTIAGSVGLLELGLFTIHDLKVKSLKNKEVKLANKIASSDASDELSNTMSQKKFYKICKKFAKVQLKLAKHQYHDKKPLSFSIRPLGLATNKQNTLYYKVKKLEARSTYHALKNMPKNKTTAWQRFTDKRLEKIYASGEYDQFIINSSLAPYSYKKSLTLPVGDETKVYDERYTINCHKLETRNEFENLVSKKPFSKKEGREISISFNKDSGLKDTVVRIVPEKKLVKDCTLLVLKEAQDIVYTDESYLPLKVSFLTKNGLNKNKIIKTADELDSIIAKMENNELKF